MKPVKKIFSASLALVFLASAVAQETEIQNGQPEQILQQNEDGSNSNEKQTSESQDLTKYRLSKVNFISKGKTKVSAIERNIEKIDCKKIFSSKDELDSYLQEISQELVNTRQLENIEYKTTEAGNEDGIILINAEYTFNSSISLLVFPKPSLDSNFGIEIKFKLKDTNFLGLLNSFDVDFNLNLGDEDEPDNYKKVTTGFNCSYDYPFNIGITENTWENDLSFNWTIGQSSPDFGYKTGLTVGIPFGKNKLNLNATQGIFKNSDYSADKDDIFADNSDKFYFTEEFSISTPLTLGYLTSTTPVKYTPKISISHNWDKDGINEKNDDLYQTPFFKIAQTISTSKIDWRRDNNFRNGYSFSATQGLGWDLHAEKVEDKFAPTIEAQIQYFKGWKYAGICINGNFFAGLNSQTKIGPNLRGALDNQKYDSDDKDLDGEYALKTASAIVFNFELPIHIITTHWCEWGSKMFGKYDDMGNVAKKIFWLPHKIFKYTDFEMQINPFVDVALLKNKETGSMFSIKDGIYCAGLEVFVYPAKWRSFVVRGSLGVDVGKKFLSGKLNSDWRSPGKAWEIYFGLGRLF